MCGLNSIEQWSPMTKPSDMLARVRNATSGAWRDLVQSVRDRDGYLRRLAEETVALKARETAARRDYLEAVAYYQGGGWKADGIPVEAVTRLLNDVQASMDTAMKARVERQWELEEAVEQAFPPDDYDTRSLLVRENLMDNAVREARSAARPKRGLSPIERMLEEQRRARQDATVRLDAEPAME